MKQNDIKVKMLDKGWTEECEKSSSNCAGDIQKYTNPHFPLLTLFLSYLCRNQINNNKLRLSVY